MIVNKELAAVILDISDIAKKDPNGRISAANFDIEYNLERVL